MKKINYWQESRLVWKIPPSKPTENREINEGLREVIHYEQHGDIKSAEEAMEEVYRKVSAAGMEMNDVARLKKEQLEKLQKEESRGPVNEGLKRLADNYRGKKQRLGIFARYGHALGTEGLWNKACHLKLAWNYAKIDDSNFEDISNRIFQKEELIQQKETALERYQAACKASEGLLQMNVDRMSEHLDFLKYNPRYWGDILNLYSKKFGLWGKKMKHAVIIKWLKWSQSRSQDSLEKLKYTEKGVKDLLKASIASAEHRLEHKFIADRQLAVEMRDYARQQKMETQKQLEEIESDPNADKGLVKILKSLIKQADKEIAKQEEKLADSEQKIDKFLNKRGNINLSLKEWLAENEENESEEMKEMRKRKENAVNRLKAISAIMKSMNLTSTEAAGNLYDGLNERKDELPDNWQKLFSDRQYLPTLKFLFSGQVGARRMVFDRAKTLAKTTDELVNLLTMPYVFETLNYLGQKKNLEKKALDYIKVSEEETAYDTGGLRGFLAFVAVDPAIENLVLQPKITSLTAIGFDQADAENYLNAHRANLEDMPWDLINDRANRNWFSFIRAGHTFGVVPVSHDGVEPSQVTTVEDLFELLNIDGIADVIGRVKDGRELNRLWAEYLDTVDRNEATKLTMTEFLSYLAGAPVATSATTEKADENEEAKGVAWLEQLIKKHGNPNKLKASEYYKMLERANTKRFGKVLNWNHLDSDLSFLFEDNDFSEEWSVSKIDQMVYILDAENDGVFSAFADGALSPEMAGNYLKEKAESYTDEKMPTSEVFRFLREFVAGGDQLKEELNATLAIKGFLKGRNSINLKPDEVLKKVQEESERLGKPWKMEWDNLRHGSDLFFGQMKEMNYSDVVESPTDHNIHVLIYQLSDPSYEPLLETLSDKDFDDHAFYNWLNQRRHEDDSIDDGHKFTFAELLNLATEYVETIWEEEDYPIHVTEFVQGLAPDASDEECRTICKELRNRSMKYKEFEHFKEGFRVLFCLEYAGGGTLDAGDKDVWIDLLTTKSRVELDAFLTLLMEHGSDSFLMEKLRDQCAAETSAKKLIQFVLKNGARLINGAIEMREIATKVVERVNEQGLEVILNVRMLTRRMEENDISAEMLRKHEDAFVFLLTSQYTGDSGSSHYLDITDDAIWTEVAINFEEKMNRLKELLEKFGETAINVELAKLGEMSGVEFAKFVLEENGLYEALTKPEEESADESGV